MSAICPYCGQVYIDGTSEEYALNHCTCIDARIWQNLQAQVFQAKTNVEKLCMSEAEQNEMLVIDDTQLVEYIESSIDFIADNKIRDITVNLVHGGKIKIALAGGGTITVKRTVGHSEELKANHNY